MVEKCELTHGKGILMGQQVPALREKILRLDFYFTVLPEGGQTDRKEDKRERHSGIEGEKERERMEAREGGKVRVEDMLRSRRYP